MTRTRRLFLLYIGIVTSVASLLAAPPQPAKKPKLVVAIAIDQFRYDYLLRFRNDYHSGLARMLDHGAVFTDAHYLHAFTVTAVGHSTFLNGATPSISGIIGNEWFERESGKTVNSVSDPNTQLLSSTTVPSNPGRQGSSPRRMLVSTVGDELKMQGGDSKVIGVSLKDRSAVLPAGHMADGAYWYDSEALEWVSSTYYRSALPDWVNKLNGEHRGRQYAAAKWLPIDAANATPFCTMTKGTTVRFCGTIDATPWANEMIEEFAEQALEGEDLGRHNGTDLLTISFSANDYVGHAVGPDDPSVRDISIRTDRLLGQLLDRIDRQVGPGNSVVVLTADHGVAPVPEVNQARHMPGGRLSAREIGEKVANVLTKRYGPGKWLLSAAGEMLYLNLELIHAHQLDPAEVERVAADTIAGEPHISRVYTRHDLETGNVQQDSIGRAFSVGFFAPRSGDVFVLQEPYYLFAASGTSHGTPYAYDNHVPVIFYGLGVKPGVYAGAIAVNDIAPTLAAMLGVTEPSGSVGRILREMLP